MSWSIREGDCVEVMAGLDESSVDAVVTDPPYDLAFMGKAWDRNLNHGPWAIEALRVLRPGGHLLAFGGTRTYHRLACALEDAGFEIRDCLAWLYGSGFPKSLDVSKAIDKVPATPDAERWQGWGTALKPAFEPIVLARKPLAERNVAANVLAHGTGGMNVDGTRIEGAPPSVPQPSFSRDMVAGFGASDGRNGEMSRAAGRWPANVILDDEAAAMLDEQSGEVGVNWGKPSRGQGGTVYGGGRGYTAEMQTGQGIGYGDRGGASRFFYTAKTSRAERERGVRDYHPDKDESPLLWSSGEQSPGTFQAESTHRAARNHHPTVKPVDLMAWLCRLVTPPGGLVLDPFTGSGSTGIAALREGFNFLGIEREPSYVEIARARIQGDSPLFNLPEEVIAEA